MFTLVQTQYIIVIIKWSPQYLYTVLKKDVNQFITLKFLFTERHQLTSALLTTIFASLIDTLRTKVILIVLCVSQYIKIFKFLEATGRLSR